MCVVFCSARSLVIFFKYTSAVEETRAVATARLCMKSMRTSRRISGKHCFHGANSKVVVFQTCGTLISCLCTLEGCFELGTCPAEIVPGVDVDEQLETNRSFFSRIRKARSFCTRMFTREAVPIPPCKSEEKRHRSTEEWWHLG